MKHRASPPLVLESALASDAPPKVHVAAGSTPNSRVTEPIDPQWAWHHRTLLGLRQRLIQSHDEHATQCALSDDRREVNAADQAREEIDRDTLWAELRLEEDKLFEVDSALQRLRDGVYGFCAETGHAIPKQRLRAIPWTRYALAAAQTFEDRRGRARTHEAGEPAGAPPVAPAPPPVKHGATMTPTLTTPLNKSERLDEQIRQRAYSLWLELGCPHGQEREHWFVAEQQVLTEHKPAAVENPLPANRATSHFTIENTLAAHLTDPTHRFHGPGVAHDARLDVVAGEARQRVRGRHFDSSLRAQPKKRQ